MSLFPLTEFLFKTPNLEGVTFGPTGVRSETLPGSPRRRTMPRLRSGGEGRIPDRSQSRGEPFPVRPTTVHCLDGRLGGLSVGGVRKR